MNDAPATPQEFTWTRLAGFLWRTRTAILIPTLLAALVVSILVAVCPPDLVPSMYSKVKVHRLVMNLDPTSDVLAGLLQRTPADYVAAVVLSLREVSGAKAYVSPETGQFIVELRSIDSSRQASLLNDVLIKSLDTAKIGLKDEARLKLLQMEEVTTAAEKSGLEFDKKKTADVRKALLRYLDEDYVPLGGVSNQPESMPDRRLLYAEFVTLLVFFSSLALYLVRNRNKENS